MQNLRTFPQRLFDTLLRTPPNVLNAHPQMGTQPVAESIAAQLKTQTHRLGGEAVNPITGQVDYARLRDSAIYEDYRGLAARLSAFDLKRLNAREDQLAFWLNLYNALIIDGIIHFRVRKTVQEVPGFFRRVAYHVGGYRFCADDIEHGILRANAAHPIIPGPQFGSRDPRRRYALEQLDFRIHFALVCGAKSCPPVSFYDAAQIDAQLDRATRNFLDQTVELDRDRHIVRLSRLLQWYSSDFGASAWVKVGLGARAPLLRAIVPYLDDSVRSFIEERADTLNVRFKTYDWALNTETIQAR